MDETVNTGRLLSFSDGVFAIAVTLLVFNLKVPEIPASSVHGQLPLQIKAMMPHFVTYMISFLLVAVYWSIHHRMLNKVIHVDSNFIWINMIYLMVVAFIPFPSALIGTYPDEQISTVIYLSCIVAVSILSLSMWWYASYNYRLISRELPQSSIRYFFLRGVAALSIVLLTLLLSVCRVQGAFYFLLVLPLVHRVIKIFHNSSLNR